MVACSDIKEIGLEKGKKLNTESEKNCRTKESIRENIGQKRLEVLRAISERTKNKKGFDLNFILLNIDSDLMDNSDVLLTCYCVRTPDYGIISSKLYGAKTIDKKTLYYGK